MNNYQLKYSKTQVFNTRFAVKDMVGSGGGQSATTLKSSDNSVILNADPNGEIDIRRNNYICRCERREEEGYTQLVSTFSAIFRPTQEQDVPQNRRAQTFTLTNKNGFCAKVTIIARDTIIDIDKDITVFAEGDTSSKSWNSPFAVCLVYNPIEEQDAVVVTISLYVYDVEDENERIYVSTDGDNTFVDFMHGYDYIMEHIDEIEPSVLFQGNLNNVLPSFAYVDAYEKLKVGDEVSYVNSPKIVPFHIAVMDAFTGGHLINRNPDVSSYETYSNAIIDTIPLFHIVESSQRNYDFYTQSYVILKNLTDSTTEQLLTAMQDTSHPSTFIVSTFLYYGKYHCTFYWFDIPML